MMWENKTQSQRVFPLDFSFQRVIDFARKSHIPIPDRSFDIHHYCHLTQHSVIYAILHLLFCFSTPSRFRLLQIFPNQVNDTNQTKASHSARTWRLDIIFHQIDSTWSTFSSPAENCITMHCHSVGFHIDLRIKRSAKISMNRQFSIWPKAADSVQIHKLFDIMNGEIIAEYGMWLKWYELWYSSRRYLYCWLLLPHSWELQCSCSKAQLEQRNTFHFWVLRQCNFLLAHMMWLLVLAPTSLNIARRMIFILLAAVIL